MSSAVSHVSPYGGSWYPRSASELDDLLTKLFENARERNGPCLLPRPLGFVVPHAGLIYSGTVAAAAYRHIQEMQPGRVLLLGFAHRGSPPGIWIPDVDEFRTPTGRIAVDRVLGRELVETPEFGWMPEANLCDHSVEIQLPLLMKAAPHAKIVPLYVGQLDKVTREAAAQVLVRFAQDGAVLVASSDFTHYGKVFRYEPFPVDGGIAARLRFLDEELIEAAGSLRPEMFRETVAAHSATVCGYEPIALLLATLRLLDGDDEIFQETLDYQTSGEVTGDFRTSVSYAALGYFRHSSFLLNDCDQELLLESARNTLIRYQQTGAKNPVPAGPGTLALSRRAPVFVTLHQDGCLRGCVGRCVKCDSLAAAVPELALAAALEDPRFEPLSREESGIEIEISVLSPMKRIPDHNCFRTGVHGAFLHSGTDRGLLLPQVASERGWSAVEFFDALARKAGLTPRVYRDRSTRISVFRAQVIQ